MIKLVPVLAAAAFGLAGCDQITARLGMEPVGAKEARQEAEGKAVGSACRHSGRAIEDCYSIYGWLPKASIYAGWREMDEYMRENKIETIVPQLPPAEPPGSARKKKKATNGEAGTSEDSKAEGKPETKPEASAEPPAADPKAPPAKSRT